MFQSGRIQFDYKFMLPTEKTTEFDGLKIWTNVVKMLVLKKVSVYVYEYIYNTWPGIYFTNGL